MLVNSKMYYELLEQFEVSSKCETMTTGASALSSQNLANSPAKFKDDTEDYGYQSKYSGYFCEIDHDLDHALEMTNSQRLRYKECFLMKQHSRQEEDDLMTFNNEETQGGQVLEMPPDLLQSVPEPPTDTKIEDLIDVIIAKKDQALKSENVSISVS